MLVCWFHQEASPLHCFPLSVLGGCCYFSVFIFVYRWINAHVWIVHMLWNGLGFCLISDVFACACACVCLLKINPEKNKPNNKHAHTKVIYLSTWSSSSSSSSSSNWLAQRLDSVKICLFLSRFVSLHFVWGLFIVKINCGSVNFLLLLLLSFWVFAHSNTAWKHTNKYEIQRKWTVRCQENWSYQIDLFDGNKSFIRLMIALSSFHLS